MIDFPENMDIINTREAGTVLLSVRTNQSAGPQRRLGAADWAIRFYEKHGFRLVTMEEKDRLLGKYWSIPERQTETSIVLADKKWFKREQSR